jgi:hypothetical protein
VAAAGGVDGGADTPRDPLSLRIIGRSSLLGAAVVLAVAAVYAVLLPAVGNVVAARDPAVEAVAVGDALVVTDADGWHAAEGDTGATTLTADGATLTIGRAVPAETTLGASVGTVVDDWIRDLPRDTVITKPRELTTSAGYDAVTAVAHSPTEVLQVWFVTDGVDVARVDLSAPPTVWDVASASAEGVVDSLRFVEAP